MSDPEVPRIADTETVSGADMCARLVTVLLRIMGGTVYWLSDAMERIADLLIHESNQFVERVPKGS